MNIFRKCVGAGTAIVASASSLMLGIGPASANLVLGEVDGVQLFQHGIIAQAVVDITACRQGHDVVVGVHIDQQLPATADYPPGEAHGDGFFLIKCSRADNDIRVTVGAADRPFQAGDAVCKVNLLDTRTGVFIPDQTTPCRLKYRGPLT